MKHKVFNLLIVWTTLFSLVFPINQGVLAASKNEINKSGPVANTLPGADSLSTSGLGDILLPGWMSPSPAASAALSSSLLPSWMAQPAKSQISLGTGLTPAWLANSNSIVSKELASLQTGMLPAWMKSSGPQASGLYSPGPGACQPAANIAMQVIPPPYSVSRGNTAGDTYTVTIKNNSLSAIPEISLLVDPNLGFFYLGGTAQATSSVSGTLSLIDPGTTAPGIPFTLVVSATPPEKRLLPGETIIFTFKLATNADAKSGQTLSASLVSGNSPPATCQTAVANIPTARGNLTVEKSPTTQNGKLGDVVSWRVMLKNTGLGNVYHATFSDTPGAGFTGLTINPPIGFIDLAPDASQIYTITAKINSCTNLTNTVAT